MLINIWHTIFFDPVYNGLVFFIDVIPGGDVGIAIILITLVVKTVLLPVSIKATKTQVAMKEIEPELKEIKEKHKDDRQQQSVAMMALYKKAGINPFASIFLVFLQIPILIALYFSVSRGGGVALPGINVEALYSFIPNPDIISIMFLGLQDITGRSLLLAFTAGAAQFIHTSLSMPKMEPKKLKEGEKPEFKDEMMRNMQTQMRYVLPVIIFFFAYTISAAVALYFTVSNVYSVGQEFIIRKHRKPKVVDEVEVLPAKQD